MKIVPTREEFKALMEKVQNPSISIYMPTHRGGQETRQNPIRFKNLYNRAEDMIAEKFRSTEKLQNMLKRGHRLTEDTTFWQHQSDGLAFFQTEDSIRTYQLPVKFDELVVVNDRAHIKPLLQVISADGLFYVLALSQNQTRFFRATRFHVSEVSIPGLPQNIEEMITTDKETVSRQAHAGRDTRSHSLAADSEREKLVRYFRLVDKALHQVLHDASGPLVLAAVDHHLPLFAEATRYPHLLNKGIAGSPNGLSMEQLHRRALSIVAPIFDQKRKDAETAFANLSETDRSARTLERILPAALQGRIESLFVTVGRHQWGTFDPDSLEIKCHEKMQGGAQDLYDYAAMQTFAHNGDVFALSPGEVPGGGPIAAVFRY